MQSRKEKKLEQLKMREESEENKKLLVNLKGNRRSLDSCKNESKVNPR